MRDVFDTSAAWLDRQFRQHGSRTAEYRRGDRAVTVRAAVGRTNHEYDRGDGLIVRVESRDYLVDVADLALNGVPVEPQDGDQVVDADGAGREVAYEVAAVAGGPCFRFTDGYRRRFRIHTKFAGPPTA